MIVSGLLVALAALGSGTSMFRGDAAHTGAAPAAAPRAFHRVRWSFPTGARIVSSPVASGGAIYFGSDDGNVYAVDAASGTQRWMFRTGGPVPASPAIAAGRLYVGSYDGKFYCLDAASGELIWKFATQGERRFEARGLHGMQPRTQTIADPFDVFLSSPLVALGAVYFGSGDGNVYALDAATGAVRWTFRTGDVVHASPALAGGTIFIGSWDGRVYALDAASGTERWHFDGGQDPLMHNQVGFQSSPAVADGTLFVGSRDANLYALDAATGKEKWRIGTEMSWVITSPAVSAGKVYFATSDSSRFFIADAASGKALASQQGLAYMFSSPTVAGDVVLTGVLNGSLEARDANSGELLWSWQTDASRANAGWVLTSERRFNAPLTFPSSWQDATFAGVQRQWSVGSIFSTPLVADGAIFVGSTDGRLYAIE